MFNFASFLEECIQIIERAHTEGVSLGDAEKYAAKFLHAQILVGNELKEVDLDARMRKSGVKALRAGVYLGEVQKNEKKPSDTLLEAIVNSTKLVQDEQDALDAAEVKRNELENYLSVFKDAHIYMRGIAKGKFE